MLYRGPLVPVTVLWPLLLASAVAGCGSSQAVNGAAVPRGRPPLRFEALRSHARALLERHDVPPTGVRSQIAYYAEGSGVGCGEPYSTSLAIAFGGGPLREGTWYMTADGSRRPERGEAFAVCVTGAHGDAPIHFGLHGPGGGVRRMTVTPSRDPSDEAEWLTRFANRAPLGNWVATATQRAITAARTFTLIAPPAPDYHVETSTGSHIATVGVLGLRPFENVRLLFYPVPETGSDFKANFATATTLRAAADGVAELRVQDPVRRPMECFVVKAEVRGRLLDDLDNTISSLCSPMR